MKISYKCEVCETEFDNEKDCLDCEAKPFPKPKFQVGEEVFLVMRYASEESLPFCRRKIVSVFPYGHENGYELDKYVQIGKNLTVGDKFNEWSVTDGYRPAIESEMFRLMDTVEVTNNFLTLNPKAIIPTTIDEIY